MSEADTRAAFVESVTTEVIIRTAGDLDAIEAVIRRLTEIAAPLREARTQATKRASEARDRENNAGRGVWWTPGPGTAITVDGNVYPFTEAERRDYSTRVPAERVRADFSGHRDEDGSVVVWCHEGYPYWSVAQSIRKVTGEPTS